METNSEEKITIHEGELIEGLREDPNYFAVEYNRQQQVEIEKQKDDAKLKDKKESKGSLLAESA